MPKKKKKKRNPLSEEDRLPCSMELDTSGHNSAKIPLEETRISKEDPYMTYDWGTNFFKLALKNVSGDTVSVKGVKILMEIIDEYASSTIYNCELSPWPAKKKKGKKGKGGKGGYYYHKECKFLQAGLFKIKFSILKGASCKEDIEIPPIEMTTNVVVKEALFEVTTLETQQKNTIIQLKRRTNASIEFRVELPCKLAKILKEDYERINVANLLLKLPVSRQHVRKITSDIVREYSQDLISENTSSCSGIALVHDLASLVDTYWRYISFAEERAQITMLLKKFENVKPSYIVGSVHLLRLLIWIPKLVSETKMDSSNLKQLHNVLGIVTRYMERHTRVLFSRIEYVEKKFYFRPT